MDVIKIKSISWHNIYLSIQLQGENITSYKYFVTNFIKEYPLDVENEIIKINIVNIKDTKLLDNDKWYISYHKDNEKERNLLSVCPSCGYQLENLDKIFRYGKECYAYIVNFQITDSDTILTKAKKKNSIVNYTTNNENDLILCMFTSYVKRNDHPEKKDIRLESDSFKQLVRKIVFIITKASIRILYNVLNIIRKKDGHHILFMSETRVPISGNLKAIDDRIKQRNLDERFKISYSFSKTLQQSKFKTFFTWSRLLWLIAKQDYIFVDDYVPIFKTISVDQRTKLVQVWHAGVGFKAVGYARFGKAGSPLPKDSCHRKYDYALVGSKGLVPVYEEVFGIDSNRIIATGLPRLDDYLNEKEIQEYQDEFYKDFPELKNKEIIMFAPTYRGNTQKDAYYPFDKIDMEKISELCENGYAFIFKMHPFIRTKIDIPDKYQAFIKDLSDYDDINKMFYITDVLITDFSSNIYEFSLHHKPIIFYVFDKDNYQLTRGVHRNVDDAPGNICEEFDDVINVLINRTFEIEKLEKFISESFDTHQKLSSDIVIDKVLLHKND